MFPRVIGGAAMAGIALLSQVSSSAATPVASSKQDHHRSSAPPFSIPASSNSSAARSREIENKRAGWLYGPAPVNTSYYPAGDMGSQKAKDMYHELLAIQEGVNVKVTTDANATGLAVTVAGGIHSLDDFAKLYAEGTWPLTVPEGAWSGMVSNYSSDLLFSMERLSTSPYSLKRVAGNETLLFPVENAASIAGISLEELQIQGRLFSVDYSSQKDMPIQQGKNAGACQAFFYIDTDSGDFLPLAIKPNVDGSDVVFTPEDKADEWLLAKMMFNLNDFWFVEWYHLASTHSVSEIVYLAAIRTLSEDHPLMALLDRIMNLAFGIRPLAKALLLVKGGPIDEFFPWSGTTAADYCASLYRDGGAGSFTGNYLVTDLQARGLINQTNGPDLKSFPFYEDASEVLGTVHTFMKAVVDSYYSDGSSVTADNELQAWIAEAGEAAIIDFPTGGPGMTKDTVVEMMTHVAYLVAVEHGVLNTNSPVAGSSTLPLHPMGFFSALPTEKGAVDDIMKFMPPLEAAVGQVSVLAGFNRPDFEDSDQDMIHMFADDDMLGRLNDEVRVAEGEFQEAMKAFSKVVGARGFDENGLSQGMPFIWDSMDPSKASYWLTI